MKNTTLFMAIAVAGILATFAVTQTVLAQTTTSAKVKVPDWVKTTTTFWAKGDISDAEYLNAIEFLVKEKIMVIPSTVQVAEGVEISKSLESLQARINQLEKASTSTATAKTAPIQDIADPKIQELERKINDLNMKVDDLNAKMNTFPGLVKEEASNRQLSDLATVMSLKTYVKIVSGPAGMVKVSCDSGDIATGGGGRSWGGGLDFSIPNTETNYGKPTGWAIREYDDPTRNIEVYVICLDITP